MRIQKSGQQSDKKNDYGRRHGANDLSKLGEPVLREEPRNRNPDTGKSRRDNKLAFDRNVKLASFRRDAQRCNSGGLVENLAGRFDFFVKPWINVLGLSLPDCRSFVRICGLHRQLSLYDSENGLGSPSGAMRLRATCVPLSTSELPAFWRHCGERATYVRRTRMISSRALLPTAPILVVMNLCRAVR